MDWWASRDPIHLLHEAQAVRDTGHAASTEAGDANWARDGGVVGPVSEAAPGGFECTLF